MINIIGLKKFFETSQEIDLNKIEDSLSHSIKDKKSEYNILSSGNSVLGCEVPLSNSVLEHKSQSFTDKTARYSIVLDGEIYNYQELKNNLLKVGVHFSTTSEIEVLLYHIINNKEEGIKDLRGSFAFVFYDNQEDEMIAARDHIGIKPLLYSIQNDEIIFASDLFLFKNIVEDMQVNTLALNTYFRFTYIPAPDTVLLGVHKLLPGHYLKIKGKDIDIVQYYSIRATNPIDVPYEEAIKVLKTKLESSVIERLHNETNYGAFLSGGVDSSIISQITSTINPDLNTFSIGFTENEFFDESKYAKNVAAHIHSNHHLIQLGKDEVVQSFNKVFSSFDEPYADSSVVALYFLVETTQKSVNVCLSGDGADEIFAGYNKHKAYMRSKNPGVFLKWATQIAHRLPGGNRRGKITNRIRQLKKFHLLLQKTWPDTYWSLAQFISRDRRDSLLMYSKDYQNQAIPIQDSLQNFLYTDQEFILPYDMLKKVDVISRHHGFNIKPPFLDVEFVNYANSLPEAYKLEGNIGKKILRDAYRKILPNEVFSRAKRGFEIPLHHWIEGAWDAIIKEEWFEDAYLQKQGLFLTSGVEQLKQEFFDGKEEEATIAMWTYIVFQNWYNRWMKR